MCLVEHARFVGDAGYARCRGDYESRSDATRARISMAYVFGNPIGSGLGVYM